MKRWCSEKKIDKCAHHDVKNKLMKAMVLHNLIEIAYDKVENL